jgi:DeoR family transcriptional regulator, fructose operon transcriptional repressor
VKAAERQIRIRQMFEQRDFVDLETLCRELDASESSIRRDLDALEEHGVVRRVYGGAVPAPSAANGDPFDFNALKVRQGDEKSRIAKLAAGLVQNGQTVVLDGGSTAAAVARELSGRHLHIVTNSLPIAEELLDSRTVELTLTGGYLDTRLRVMLGPFCEQMLGAIRADVLIMGIGSISEAGLSNNNTLVVGSEKKMIEIATKVIIVADHTKFNRGAMIPLAPIDVVDVFVSDDGLAPEFRQMLQAHGVELLLA